MSIAPHIEVELQMQRSLSDGYRPHLRVDDGEFLGVSFFDVGPENPAVSLRAKAVLMYFPNVDYTVLKIGTRFKVVEGTKTVGSGTVTVGWSANEV